MLATGVLLLGVFVWIQSRTGSPLLPLKVVTDRNRSASYVSIGIAGAALFGVFLFLTYYLQQNRGYSPVTTGVAFLPMTLAVMVTAVITNTKLSGRFSPRVLVAGGMSLGAAGMLGLTQLSLTSGYAGAILPSLMAMGVGMGLVFGTAMNNATIGVDPADSGVASALVSAAQQVGGSLGTALLSTLAASAATSFVTSNAVGRPTQALLAHAAMHGYTTAFAVAAGMFAAGAVIAGLLYERGVKQPELGAEPVLAH
jgi:predicted MFS family arabinose efflux permease